MYDKLKNYNEFIEECFSKDNPFGLELSYDCGLTKQYTDGNVKIEVRTNKSNEIIVLENYKSIFGYIKNDTYESLNTPSYSYFKNNCNEISYKEYSVNGILVSYSEDTYSGYRLQSTSEHSKYIFQRNSSIDTYVLETTFHEEVIPNIHIKERGPAYMNKPTSSTVFFRAPDPTGKIRDGKQNVMYTMDISKKADGVKVLIEIGYYKKLEFYIDATDASVLNIFDDQCMFQAELGLEHNEVVYLSTIRKAIVNKLKYSQDLSKNPIVSTVLRNIKEKMKQ